MAEPGDLFAGRYRIEAQLGEGGMGAVYAAVNQTTGRSVAIKCLHAQSKDAVARFMVEARATSKIEHPNVIQIFDVQEEDGAPFLVMERLRGRSLADRLKTGPLSVPETLAIAIAACRGVAAAHAEGIVHRDLKPDNIFLCEGKDGDSHPPKVLDFGISKLYDDQPSGAHTKTGTTMGTPQYMSPEQLSASMPADGRFDVYAMGVVLYECLTGRRPYEAPGLFELVQEIAAGRPRPIRELAPHVTPELEAVVMRAMSNDRDFRHPTMKHLIRDLEQLAQGSVPIVPTRTIRAAKPSYLPYAIGAGVLGVLALGFFAVLAAGGAFYALSSEDERVEPVPVVASVPAPAARPVDPLAPDIDLRFSGSCVMTPTPPFAVSPAQNGITIFWGQGNAQAYGQMNISITGDETLGTIPMEGRSMTPPAIVTLMNGNMQGWGNVRPPDPARIEGAIIVRRFDHEHAVADLTLQGVTIQARNGTTCIIDGRVVTRGTIFWPH